MKIDAETCILCQECFDYCPMGCIVEGKASATIDQDDCVECGVCYRADVCPVDAIYMPEESLQYPRSIRAQFSDPDVQHPKLNQGGRCWRIKESNMSHSLHRLGTEDNLKN